MFRARLGEVHDRAKVRRAARIALCAALLVAVGLGWLQVALDWTGVGSVRTVVVITLAAIGTGCVVFACCPIASRPDPAATINGRQIRPDTRMAVRQSVSPYLLRRAREVRPEDAEAVRNDVTLLQRGLTRRLVRTGSATAGLACGGLSVVLIGSTNWFIALWPFLYGIALPELVVELGRSERARRSALAVEPPGPTPEGPRWRRDPTGTKLGLPGE